MHPLKQNDFLPKICTQAIEQFPLFCNILFTGNPKRVLFASSEDPDEMQHNAAFHQGLNCLLRRKIIQGHYKVEKVLPVGTEVHNVPYLSYKYVLEYIHARIQKTFCQRGSNFDNVFFCLFLEGIGSKQIPL